ncbi:hypothetical protein BRD00_12750 [Halobacteriales archaeon QS_8_69_26]|nr:MAG: hypothetical protein BRD00_12750 [Halobacteriales archaeon QS_8_69_26]
MASGDDRRGDDASPGGAADGDGTGDDEGSGDPRSRANTPDVETEEASWRFELDDVDEDGIVRTEIEPEELDPENVAFVILGVIAMVLVFFRLSMLVG